MYRGPQGAGKGLLARALGRLFGQHFMHVSQPKHLVGHFNAHLRDVVVLFCDEAFWAGDKKNESTLKMLITEPTIAIEAKGRDVVVARNMLHVIMASNYDWVVPANLDERRFAVFDVSGRRAQDGAYFGVIVEQLKSGGYEAMLYDLLHRDISAVDLRRIPDTDALREQKIQSMEPHEQWWYQKLVSSFLLTKRPGCLEGIEWEENAEPTVPCAWLHGDYIETLGKAGVNRRAMETELGLRLRRLLPKGYPRKGRQDVEETNIGPDGFVVKTWGRHYTWTFPSLPECRKHFDKITRSAWEWPAIPPSNY